MRDEENRVRKLILAAVAGATLGLGVSAGLQLPAKADAPSNGCPSGYQLLSTDALVAEGYVVAGLVDSQTSGVLSHGRPGNGDGSVCAVQLGNRLTHFGLPFYNFIDNTLPPSG